MVCQHLINTSIARLTQLWLFARALQSSSRQSALGGAEWQVMAFIVSATVKGLPDVSWGTGLHLFQYSAFMIIDDRTLHRHWRLALAVRIPT